MEKNLFCDNLTRSNEYTKGIIVEISHSIEKIRSSGQAPLTKTGGFVDIFIVGHPITASISAYEADE
jgi:hypothetical protein